MSEEFGPDFITVTDEDGNEFELEHLDTLEYNGQTYMAFFPAVPEGGAEEEEDEYGLIILKAITVDGEEQLSTLDSEEELEAVYQQFMETLFADEDGGRAMTLFPARCGDGLYLNPHLLNGTLRSQRRTAGLPAPLEVGWTLEATKRCGGDPPAISCRF